MENLAQDEAMMEKALRLAMQARVIAPPNPWVGCVIANDGKIVGEGFTQAPGGAHAEIVALAQAGNLAKGATAYVTLEPCAHFGRTPPCVDALINAGITRVVIGIQDPDIQVQGKGIARLRAAGIHVTENILAEAITESLAPYLFHRMTGLPYCLLKGAASIDGRVAAEDGTSQWISSKEALIDCHRIRAESQAILIGSGTAIADTPTLNVRNVEQYPSKPPLRVILDAHGRVPANGPLFDISIAPTLIITSENCPDETKKEWLSHGVQVETVPIAKNGVGLDLHKVLILLGRRGILQLMIEGGGTILGSFIEAGIINHLSLFIGGRILGQNGIPLFATDCIKTLKDSPQLQLLGAKILGNSVRLDYKIKQ